jgi:membrane-associated phospholipid phosphatase
VTRANPPERLSAGYFALTALFVPVSGASLREWWPTVALHLAIVAVALWLLPRLPQTERAGILRAWLPVLGLPLVYGEVALLNDLFTTGYYDQPVQRWEAAVFGSQLSVTLRAMLPWKPLSEYLHFGYFGYYVLVPLLLGVLYARGEYSAFRAALTTILATFYFCYLVFIVFPVAGPWYHFPRPDPADVGWFFPFVIRRVLATGASQGAAFPSSHVAAAVISWLLAWHLARPLFWSYALIVPALVVGTVYGGFHYAIDALAGVGVAICAWGVARGAPRVLRSAWRG